MKRMLALLVVLAGVAVLTGFTSGPQATRGTVYIGMDTPLTGPQAIVGQGDREAILALANYWNARGGINGRRLVVDVLDNASNPSQGVQNVQRFASDPKYVAILGSGNAAAAVATAPLATAARDPVPCALAADNARRTSASVRLRRASDVTALRVQHGAVPEAPRVSSGSR